MAESKFTFEDLKVYQKSLDFVDMAYKTCERFPKEEKYRLSSQFIRAATSISLNIAEGSCNTDAQFNRFLQIARGSVMECVVCSTISQKRGYITIQKEQEFRSTLTELSKMITSLQSYLKNKIERKSNH